MLSFVIHASATVREVHDVVYYHICREKLFLPTLESISHARYWYDKIKLVGTVVSKQIDNGYKCY